MSCALSAERVWLDKAQYSDAERKFYESSAKNCSFVTEDTNKGESVGPEMVVGKSKRGKKARKEAKESTEAADQAAECPHIKSKKEKQLKGREEVSGALSECPVMSQVTESVDTGKKKRNQKTKSVENSVSEAPEGGNTAKKSKAKRRKEKKAQEEAEDTSEEMETTSEHSTNVSPKVKASADTVSAPAAHPKARAAEKKHHKDAEGQKGAKEDEKGGSTGISLVSEIAKARQHIKKSLERMDGIAALASTPGNELFERLTSLESENKRLHSVVTGMEKLVISLQERVSALEKGTPAKAAAPAPPPKVDDDDDGVDLFASESEEDEAANEVKEARLAEYNARKSKKPTLIAKSNIILDIKPWDDETDMKAMEAELRKIEMEGLLWGASKLVPLAYGIHKLQVSCVVEDEKVSVDLLTEEIEKIEDLVQSVDIAAFNKI